MVYDGEMLHEPNHEMVGIDVRLKIVYLRLLKIAEIAKAHGCARTDIDIGHQLVTHVGRTDKGSGNYIMIVVATREYLVVGLTVIRAEHDAKQWQLGLITQGCTASEDSETPRGCCRGHDIERDTCLCGIVAV